MSQELPTVSEIYVKGQTNMEKIEVKLPFSLGTYTSAIPNATRNYLDSLFFTPCFIDTAEADTSITLFGQKLKTPVFCSALSKYPFMSDNWATDVATGIAKAGSLMMLGLGGSDELQKVIDTGAPVIKIVKPYRRTELIYEKIHDAEKRGCIAVGMDVSHALGRLRGDRVDGTDMRGPQTSAELKKIIASTKLPFIIKGVLNLSDAEKAVAIGAAAVLVSNHAANSFLFGLPSPLALPPIAEKVGKKLVVLVDSGFKTGNDALKGLALGAKAVGMGNPIVMALMADGATGVENLLNQITAELHRSMVATNCAKLVDINKSILTTVR
ncbi:MAG: L-lactate dehydrogenase (cytochrome) [Smithella sp. PtaU1.Bin162]|nr:MAG: L-lactate dehydrogenase (cytochrome) [Smithella sp. PtaU1.Bin162]